MNEVAMPNNHNDEKIRELTWRRNLTLAQQRELESWLEAHPEKHESFALEARLTASLGKLPDAPVSSNFTALVLEKARLEQRAAARKPSGRAFFLRWGWLVQAATAVVLVAAFGVSWKHFQSARAAGEMARTVSVVSEIPSLPSPDLLRDFEAIQALSQAPPADMELLALLK